MISRRTLVLAVVLAALGTTDLRVWATPPASDPLAIINAIYMRAAKGKGIAHSSSKMLASSLKN